MIFPSVYPYREPLGYVPGSIRSFEVSVTKYGGTTGLFNVRLDQGAELKVTAGDGYATLVPGDRVCIRATRRGELVEGDLVSMGRCLSGS